MSDDVWFGVHAAQEGCNLEDINEICLESERHGYFTFTVMDHFMNQFKSYEKGAHRIEAWTLLGGLAAHAPDVAFAIIMNLNVKSRTKSSLASMMTKKG